jgi:hypothetical protein
MQTQKPWGQILFGFAAITVSAVIILGSLSFALLEGEQAIAQLSGTTDRLQSTAFQITVMPGEPTYTPVPPSPTPSVPPPVSCPPPDGWVAYDVKPDDTLTSLADLLGWSVETIASGNCLPSSSTLIAGIILYLPYPASPTPSATEEEQQAPRQPAKPSVQCGRPAGWITYIVRYGDTLYSIAQRYYTTVALLQNANCLSSTVIRAGKILYVPNVATRTPYPTPTPLPTTLVPTTLAPSTPAPTTLVPTIPPPTTQIPTTLAPTTPPATTVAPTTAIPTTVEPTTPPPDDPLPTAVMPTAPTPPTPVPTDPPPTTEARVGLYPADVCLFSGLSLPIAPTFDSHLLGYYRFIE